MIRHEFDDLIDNYRELHSKQIALSGESGEFFAAYKAEKLAQWLPQLQGPVAILDFGCGDGLMASRVHHRFSAARVIGVDASPRSVEHAQRKYGGEAEFLWANDRHLPFPDATFDMIYASGVFHHIPFGEHAGYLDEIFRALKSNGAFVLFEVNPFNPLSVWIFKTGVIDKSATMIFPARARKTLKPYGRIKTKYYFFFPGFTRFLRVLEPYLEWLPLGGLYACVVKPEAKSVL